MPACVQCDATMRLKGLPFPPPFIIDYFSFSSSPPQEGFPISEVACWEGQDRRGERNEAGRVTWRSLQ